MKKFLLLFGLLLLALVAHTFSQYHLFSLFQAVTSIPLFLMLILPPPTAFIVCAVVLFELFSSLPHGSTSLMFLVPYLVLFFWKKFRVELSWKFLFGVLCIITLQNAVLLSIVALMNPSYALQIPWKILGMQILATTVGTFVLSFVYHEYSERL